MTPTVTTELISRFAGYLDLYDDDARLRQDADGAAMEDTDREAVLAALERYDAALGEDWLDSTPTRGPAIPRYADGFEPGPGERGALPELDLIRGPGAFTGTAPSPPAPLGFGDRSGRGAEPPEVRIQYQDGGAQAFALIRQSNTLTDGDLILFDGVAMETGGFGIDVPGDALAMLAAARSVRPTDLEPASYDPDAIAAHFRGARDAKRDDTDEAGDQDVSGLQIGGLHVDGEADGVRDVDTARVLDPLTTARPDTDGTETDDLPTGSLSAGGNDALNVAAVFDVNEAALSLVVMGDRYSLDAIVQTNVAHDVDAPVAGGLGIEGLLAGSGVLADAATIAENVADFVAETGDLAAPRPGFGSASVIDWTVDVFDGDFFDITLIEQINAIGDADGMAGRIADDGDGGDGLSLSAGDNLGANTAQFASLSLDYDLIVIGGGYFDADIIYQTNILFDGDVGAAPATEDNILLNDAEIRHVGAQANQAITPELSALVDHLAARGGGFTLDRALTEQLPNTASSSFDILYVTGDYFDLTVIDQRNLVFDRDAISGPADVSGAGNTLGNSALIVDAGTFTTAQYLGGDAYSDTLLVQANLVADGHGLAVEGTEALVPELIAFLSTDAIPVPDIEPDGPFGGALGGGAEDILSGLMA